MRNYVRCALLATSTLVATVVAAAGPAKPPKNAQISAPSSTPEAISVSRRDFLKAISISVLGRFLAQRGVADTHNVYARPRMLILLPQERPFSGWCRDHQGSA